MRIDKLKVMCGNVLVDPIFIAIGGNRRASVLQGDITIRIGLHRSPRSLVSSFTRFEGAIEDSMLRPGCVVRIFGETLEGGRC